jgi:hypothetical protein
VGPVCDAGFARVVGSVVAKALRMVLACLGEIISAASAASICSRFKCIDSTIFGL